MALRMGKRKIVRIPPEVMSATQRFYHQAKVYRKTNGKWEEKICQSKIPPKERLKILRGIIK